MSSIQASEDDTTRFLNLLNLICERQKTICKLLDGNATVKDAIK